jgi:hypothetical protein
MTTSERRLLQFARVKLHNPLDFGPPARNSEPQADSPLNGRKLSRRESPQQSYKFGVRNRDEVLRVEHTGTKHRNVNRNFESRVAGARGVRNEGHEGAVAVISRDADDGRRPDLGRHAEINKPDLAPLRRLHYDCSKRSSAMKRRSAAATRSSSPGRSCGANAVRRSNSATSSARSWSGNASNSSSSFLLACVMESDWHRAP